MPPIAPLSHRTAFAPATARAKKLRTPAPQAHLTIAITGVRSFTSTTGGDPGFIWSYNAQVRHLASGFTKDLSGTTTTTAVTASHEQTRAQITGGARSIARTFLGQAGHDVPEDRIAVVLL